MSVRYFALAIGVIFLAIGIMGFVDGFVQEPQADAPDLTVDQGYGDLMGLFPVNVLHNLVHLGSGLLGIAAYTRYDTSRLYARVLGVVYLLLTIMGLIPGLNTTFGLVPIFSHDIWLHGLIGLAALYFGFIAGREDMPIGPARTSTTRSS
jgi:hypothetical protein